MGLFDVKEDVGNNVVFRPGITFRLTALRRTLKTNGLPLNTFINLCKLFPKWMLKVQRTDKLDEKTKINSVTSSQYTISGSTIPYGIVSHVGK